MLLKGLHGSTGSLQMSLLLTFGLLYEEQQEGEYQTTQCCGHPPTEHFFERGGCNLIVQLVT